MTASEKERIVTITGRGEHNRCLGGRTQQMVLPTEDDTHQKQ